MYNESRESNKNDEKILIAKIYDKQKFSITKNKITYSDFLNLSEISAVTKKLKEDRINNYIVFGGRENSDRSLLIFYPEKFTLEMVEKNYNNIFEIIRIILPSGQSYEHREFLSGIMKLGIKREKFGDIIVTEYGADIICLKEVSEILSDGLKELTRFRKAKISLEDINNIYNKENEFENLKIIVTSLRLDNFVSELARTSRTKAEEIIKEGRVFINSINEYKDSKKININDIITIRGKGKFIFDDIERKTGNEKYVINLRKYK